MDIDAAFGNWLAGFIDGEGCFSIGINNYRRPSLRFDISVRLDDAAILGEIHEQIGIGKLIERPARYASMAAGKPQLVWRVQKREECWRLRQLLDKYPLRAKKKRDYAIWRLALEDMRDHVLPSGPRNGVANPEDDAYLERMEGYRDALRKIRQYDVVNATLGG